MIKCTLSIISPLVEKTLIFLLAGHNVDFIALYGANNSILSTSGL